MQVPMEWDPVNSLEWDHTSISVQEMDLCHRESHASQLDNNIKEYLMLLWLQYALVLTV